MSSDSNQNAESGAFRLTEIPSVVELRFEAPVDKTVEGQVIEVGVGGLRARVSEEVPQGTLCTVHFTDAEVGGSTLRAYVHRAQQDAAGVIVGVEFETPLHTVRAPAADDHLEGLELGATRVLVVDDEPGVVELLYRFLSGLGCEVTTARSGAEALEALRQSSPDFTLLDIRMPEMDGLEVLDAIRVEGLDAGKVWVVSGYANDAEAQQALERGAADFISKPLDLKYLEWSLRLHRAAS